MRDEKWKQLVWEMEDFRYVCWTAISEDGSGIIDRVILTANCILSSATFDDREPYPRAFLGWRGFNEDQRRYRQVFG